jgi:hypothetical protein
MTKSTRHLTHHTPNDPMKTIDHHHWDVSGYDEMDEQDIVLHHELQLPGASFYMIAFS